MSGAKSRVRLGRRSVGGRRLTARSRAREREGGTCLGQLVGLVDLGDE
jgi:hypothetical protein